MPQANLRPVIPLTTGCKRDVEKLLVEFKKAESLSFEAFSKCFREVDFVTIFMGRISCAELVEFSEKLLQMSISYAMSFRKRVPEDFTVEEMSGLGTVNDSGEHTLQERIFGIYLTYSLYYVQPGDFVSSVRVTPEQAHDLAHFVQEILLPGGYHDAVLAYYRMVSYDAFRVVAFEKEYNPLLHKRFDRNIIDEGVLPQFEDLSLFKYFANDSLFLQAELIHKRYQAAKSECGLPEISIANVIKHSISEIYNDVLKNVEAKDSHSVHQTGQHLNTRSSRSTLKEKAYRTKAVNLRHRRHRASSEQCASVGTQESPMKPVETITETDATVHQNVQVNEEPEVFGDVGDGRKQTRRNRAKEGIRPRTKKRGERKRRGNPLNEAAQENGEAEADRIFKKLCEDAERS